MHRLERQFSGLKSLFSANKTLILTSAISLAKIAKLYYLGCNFWYLWKAKDLDICLDAMYLHLEALLMINKPKVLKGKFATPFFG